jgi:hypothetical protein
LTSALTQSARLGIRHLFVVVALTPPGFLKRREWRPQSQPHVLQYHSVMPSHSSRSASIALPAFMARWNVGVTTPWITGMTEMLLHSGQDGIRFVRFLVARLRTMVGAVVRTLFQISAFSVEAPSTRMQRYIVGRFLVVGAKLAHADRFEIVARDLLAALLDRLAESVGDIVR